MNKLDFPDATRITPPPDRFCQFCIKLERFICFGFPF
jgi:hypothetical protein